MFRIFTKKKLGPVLITLPRKETLSRQIEDYLIFRRDVRRLSPDTIYGDRTDLMHFQKFTRISRIEEIDNAEVNRWIMWQKNAGCRASTVNTRISRLKSFIKWEKDMNVEIPNLKIGLVQRLEEDPPHRVWYDRDTINRVLCVADRKAWLMIRLSFECGLRIAELQKLKLENIKGREITFVGKCRINADLMMSPETKKRLDDWIKREHITNYLWPGQSGKNGEERPLCKSSIRECMRGPFAKVGIADFYPHALRHSFATEVVLNGATDEEAQHMLRHTNLKNTRIYVHDLGVRVRQNFDKYMHCKDDENLR